MTVAGVLASFPIRRSVRLHQLAERWRRDQRAGQPTGCVYCGAQANSLDHVPPQHIRGQLRTLGIPFDAVEVPACKECNSLLGARPLWRFSERKGFIHDKLKTRYRHLLAIPDWPDSELVGLSTSLQGYVKDGVWLREFIRARIRHAGSGNGLPTMERPKTVVKPPEAPAKPLPPVKEKKPVRPPVPAKATHPVACLGCGNPFETRHSKRTFCTVRCKTAYHASVQRARRISRDAKVALIQQLVNDLAEAP